MNQYPKYEYAISLTSQFYFCALPLRLDVYSRCLFACEYCFASERGGHRSAKGLKIINPDSLEKMLQGRRGRTSIIDELIARRQPIHLGGMSDPFPPLEGELKATLRVLEILADNDYPTVISTKSTIVARDEYIEILSRGDFVVQISFSTSDDTLASRIDFGAPLPTERLAALTTLAKSGIKTACRLQPLLPGHENEAIEFVGRCAEAGVRHVGVEHLKLALEGSNRIDRLAQAMSQDIRGYYANVGSQRLGREWVLPVKLRLPILLRLRKEVRSYGMTFGAADTDLLPMSDGLCCCSGADILLRGGNPFEFNYIGAVRRASASGLIRFSSLDGCWAPTGSIARYVNSNSRLHLPDGRGATIEDYLRSNWNGRKNGCSPQMFYGVELTGQLDDAGLAIYALTDEFQRVLGSA